MLGRRDLGADRARHDAADLGDHLEKVAAGFGDQRRVGGDSVDQTGGGKLADLVDVSGIHEEFHDLGLISLPHSKAMRSDIVQR